MRAQLGVLIFAASAVLTPAANRVCLGQAAPTLRCRGLSRSTVPSLTFVAADALVLKVREGGRVVNVHALLATGVNADGHREILGLDVTSGEDGAGWLVFFRGPTAAA